MLGSRVQEDMAYDHLELEARGPRSDGGSSRRRLTWVRGKNSRTLMSSSGRRPSASCPTLITMGSSRSRCTSCDPFSASPGRKPYFSRVSTHPTFRGRKLSGRLRTQQRCTATIQQPVNSAWWEPPLSGASHRVRSRKSSSVDPSHGRRDPVELLPGVAAAHLLDELHCEPLPVGPQEASRLPAADGPEAERHVLVDNRRHPQSARDEQRRRHHRHPVPCVGQGEQ